METTEQTFKESVKEWLKAVKELGTSTAPFVKETERIRVRLSYWEPMAVRPNVTALVTMRCGTEPVISALVLYSSEDVLAFCDILDGIGQL